MKKIVIIGAGITGLTAAERLSRIYKERVVLIEKEPECGGLASTFHRGETVFDLGSHRMHIETPVEILKYLQQTLEVTLLRRKRRGKLYFQGTFLAYPPNIFNLLKVFSTRDIFRSVISYLKNYIKIPSSEKLNFESAMIRAVGFDIYSKIYRDYAKKLWGIEPCELSLDAVLRRKTVLDIKSLRKAFQDKHFFLYPPHGIGEISQALVMKIRENGGRIFNNCQIQKVQVKDGEIVLFPVSASQPQDEIIASHVISTVPIDDLHDLFFGGKMTQLSWRGIRLLYIKFDRKIEDAAETFYFPSSDIILGRVSELSKYSPHINIGLQGSFLTVEIPVSLGDTIWQMDKDALLEICLDDLRKTKVIAQDAQVLDSFSFSLPKVYPIYRVGWRAAFDAAYTNLQKINNLFSVGRSGLFLHCNMDHCFTQGMRIAECIVRGDSTADWHKQVRNFLKYSARD